MRRSPHKIWFAIVLMLMQLVINGTSLAMTLGDWGTVEVPPATMSECADHSVHPHEIDQNNDKSSSDGVQQDDSDTEDCCKQGGCACPCLHGATALLFTSQNVSLQFAESRMFAVVGVLPHGRMNSPFRPPA